MSTLIRKGCLQRHDLIYQTTERILSRQDVFRELMIRNWWQSPLFLLIIKTNVKNWQCCLKRRPREANIFHVLPLPSAWGRTVDFNVLFLIYMLIMFRWSPKEITQTSGISKHNVWCLLRVWRCNIRLLNILLFLLLQQVIRKTLR